MTELLIGRSTSVSLDPHYGNRHGMIAGAITEAERTIVRQRSPVGGIFGGKR